MISTGPTYPPLPFTDEVYALVSKALGASGTFAFQELVTAGSSAGSQGALSGFRTVEQLPLALKLAGFLAPNVETRLLSEEELGKLARGAWASPDPEAAVQAALRAGLSVASVTASKPSYATGSASSIKLNLRKKQAERAEVRSPPPAVVGWSDNSGDDGELEDEDALLDEADRAKPARREFLVLFVEDSGEGN